MIKKPFFLKNINLYIYGTDILKTMFASFEQADRKTFAGIYCTYFGIFHLPFTVKLSIQR